MIRLVSEDRQVTLFEQQVSRIKFWLLEFLPAAHCEVAQGPGVEIVVRDRRPEDLTPALLRRVEQVAGCRLRLDGE